MYISETQALILLVVFLLIFVALPLFVRFLKADKRRCEAICNERNQKEKESEAQKQRTLAALKNHAFIVHIREKDGRKSTFETFLIQELLCKSATVELSTEAEGQAVACGDTTNLKNDTLAIVGTFWANVGRTQFSCDLRIIAANEGDRGKIVGANGTTYSKHANSQQETECQAGLAQSAVLGLAKILSSRLVETEPATA